MGKRQEFYTEKKVRVCTKKVIIYGKKSICIIIETYKHNGIYHRNSSFNRKHSKF